MRKRKVIIAVLAASFVLSNAFNSFAAWEQDGVQWKYKEDSTGTYLTGWQWLDGNSDHVAECYYLNEQGIMAANTTVDGYTVNEEGQWVVNGVVQTQETGSKAAFGGVIKEEYLDALFKDRTYVESKFGKAEDAFEDGVGLVDTMELYHKLGVAFYYKNNVVVNISNILTIDTFCNLNNTDYTFQDVDTLLGGIPHEITRLGDATWVLQENPRIEFTIFKHWGFAQVGDYDHFK